MTARFGNGQNALLPMYVAQLNSYAYIAERIGIRPVSAIGLIYYEPQTDLTVENIDDVMMSNGFSMGFKAKLVPLALDPERIIPPLVKEVRRIADLDQAPRGRQGCKDCERVDTITLFSMTSRS